MTMRIGLFIERDNGAQKTEAVNDGETLSVEATPRDEVLLEEMHRRYDLQQNEIDSTDTKAGFVLAYLGTYSVVLSGSIPEIVEKMTQGGSVLLIVTTFITLMLLACGVFCCIKVIRIRTFRFPVGVEKEEVEFYLSLTREAAVRQLMRQYSDYIQDNISWVKNKGKWFLYSLFFSLSFTVAGIFTAFLAQF